MSPSEGSPSSATGIDCRRTGHPTPSSVGSSSEREYGVTANLTADISNQHLVKAIAGLAKDFGYETIAEGVEDAETLAMLAEYGVDFAQGYHIGSPSPGTGS